MSQPVKEVLTWTSYGVRLFNDKVIALPQKGQKLQSIGGTYTVSKTIKHDFGTTVLLKNEDPNGFNPAISSFDLYAEIYTGYYKIID